MSYEDSSISYDYNSVTVSMLGGRDSDVLCKAGNLVVEFLKRCGIESQAQKHCRENMGNYTQLVITTPENMAPAAIEILKKTNASSPRSRFYTIEGILCPVRDKDKGQEGILFNAGHDIVYDIASQLTPSAP